MQWQQFTMRIGALAANRVEAVFERHGACSVTLTDAGDEPLLEPAPGETPLWADTRITGLFDGGSDLTPLRQDLLRTFGLAELPECEIRLLPERVWEREWLKDFGPMRFGRRLWVCPGDTVPAVAAAAVVVRIDPGLAFGTGTHATTALCLEWLDHLDLRDKRVLDYGCGSGILSVAALKLGAAAVTAVDIDPQAVAATRRNAERNRVGGRLMITADPQTVHGQFDVVIANILASPLIELAETIGARLRQGAPLALSGILGRQVAEVESAYRPWFRFDAPVEVDGWIRLTGRRI